VPCSIFLGFSCDIWHRVDVILLKSLGILTYLLTPMTVAGVRRLAASVCDSVCWSVGLSAR